MDHRDSADAPSVSSGRTPATGYVCGSVYADRLAVAVWLFPAWTWLVDWSPRPEAKIKGMSSRFVIGGTRMK